MGRATKILALLFAVCVVLFMGTRVAKADSLSINGNLTITPSGGGQDFSFTSVSVGNSIPYPDDAIGTDVILPGTTLTSATGTAFSPASGTFQVNPACDSVGCLSGNIDWLKLVYTGTSSGNVNGFTLTVGLSSITGTMGSSAVINQFLSTGQGDGLLTLNFTAPGIDGLSSLFANGSTLSGGTFSGTLVTPEPATLGLLGVGLLGLGLIGLSRRKRSEA